LAGIEQTLRTLRDVHGVYGSFVVAQTGALVARDLPAAFDDALFVDVGPRVTRLYETFLSGEEELEFCVLRFAEHKLYLRRMTWGVIGILSGVGVNMPALRMVSNLVIRKIDPEVAPSQRQSVPDGAPFGPPATLNPTPPSARPPHGSSVQPMPETTGADAEEPEAQSRPVRMYRGRPVVDE
jgi:predicted regulator of Ras-like GTPase activity (Roadblock/LC7/MglB family)